MRSPGELISKEELTQRQAEHAAYVAAMKRRGSPERLEEAHELREDRAYEREERKDPEYVKFMKWCREVHRRGEWGPSPGGAANKLGCSRAMVDRLVAAGVLVRNEYMHEGYYDPEAKKMPLGKQIIISRASIEKAKQNKETTGKWNEEKLPDGSVRVWKLV